MLRGAMSLTLPKNLGAFSSVLGLRPRHLCFRVDLFSQSSSSVNEKGGACRAAVRSLRARLRTCHGAVLHGQIIFRTAERAPRDAPSLTSSAQQEGVSQSKAALSTHCSGGWQSRCVVQTLFPSLSMHLYSSHRHCHLFLVASPMQMGAISWFQCSASAVSAASPQPFSR